MFADYQCFHTRNYLVQREQQTDRKENDKGDCVCWSGWEGGWVTRMSGDSGCGSGVCRIQGGSETRLHQTSDRRNLYESSLICSESLRNRPLNGF